MPLSPAYVEAVRLADELLGKVPPTGSDAATALRAVKDLPTLRVLARLADALRRETELRDRDEAFETLAALPKGTRLHLAGYTAHRMGADFKVERHEVPARVVYLRGVKRGRKYVGVWVSPEPDSSTREWKFYARGGGLGLANAADLSTKPHLPPLAVKP